VEFGKNRVQYHQDMKDWLYYETRNFVTYWYGEGRNIGQSVVMMAEHDNEVVQNLLEHRINDKIEILVYKDITDLKQSNIGSEEAFVNTGGQTKIVGNKIFVYFNGDHTHLRRQIREGIASVYLNAMLFGSNLQEIVQNAVLLNLPDWFKTGLISYAGDNWNTDLDNQLRDLILEKKYKTFDKLAEAHPKLAGHAMWYYIGQQFGQSTVSNLLYLTRINRSVESGFLYVLGYSYPRISNNFMEYFDRRYKTEQQGMDEPAGKQIQVKNRKKIPLSELKVSPDGKRIAYVYNDIGKKKVYIQDLQTGKRKRILKSGFRNAFQATDYNYPMLDWSPTNQELLIIYERRDIIKLLRYDTNTGKKTYDVLPNQFQRIHSIDFVNPNTLVFSATVRGYSDLYLFYLNTRQSRRLTTDFYDDLDASFVKIDGRKGILFASNRESPELMRQKLDSILPINTFDLWYYDLEYKSDQLVRITNTPLANERQPLGVDSTWFSYVSDQSGLDNRYYGYIDSILLHYNKHLILETGEEIVLHQDSSLAKLDTALIDSTFLTPVYQKVAYTHQASNRNRPIKEQDLSPRTGKMVELFVDQERPVFYLTKVDPAFRDTALVTTHMRQVLTQVDDPEELPPSTSQLLKEVFRDPLPIPAPTQAPTGKEKSLAQEESPYLFQSEFDEPNPKPIPSPMQDELNFAPTPKDPVAQDPPILLTPPGQTKPKPEVEFEDINAVTQREKVLTDDNKKVRFLSSRIVPYRIRMRTDYVTTQMDNSLLFGGLDRYSREFSYPPPGILLKGNFKDLFEDYEVEGGIRIPTSFNGAEYFLTFNDKKKRIDKSYSVYRRALRFTDEVNVINPPKEREITTIAQATFKYPFDIFRSVRATGIFRLDRQVQLATDDVSLNTPSINQQRLGVRLEYVFDNTLERSINILNGTRYKIYTELYQSLEVDFLDNFNFNLGAGSTAIFGIDARHYIPILKHSVLAGRFAGATSLGSEKLLYVLGGVDNWLFTATNNEIPFPPQDQFSYQTLASNMRGFRFNIRNGNSYAVFNAELRVPVFRYFGRRIQSYFFRNFQLVGFFDMGTAWQGLNPFEDENPLNTLTVSNPPTVDVRVNYFRDPIVAGYGGGVRALLFGYFLRFDYGWGIETRVLQEPRFYFSLGKDF